MSYCAVIVPVLARPERVAPFVESLARSLGVFEATPYFVVHMDDARERAAIRRAGATELVVTFRRGRGDYARKMNDGIRRTEEPWIFLGADDLAFRHGWLDTCLHHAEKYSRSVVGTNDLGNREVLAGRHSTHSLVARSYVEERGTIDQTGICLHEGYDHQYVDNEFVETAKRRGQFVMASNAVVEHLHPHWGKAEPDDTYRLALAETKADRDLFRKRRRLWVSGRQTTAGARAERR